MKKNIEIGEVVDIGLIKKSRYKIHDCPKQSELALMRSVIANGQLRPIITDQNYEILDGNRLYSAMVAIGYTEVWILQRSMQDDNRCVSVVMNLGTVFNKIRPETVYSIAKKNEEVLNLVPYPRAQMKRWIKDMESVQFDEAA